MIPGNPLFFKSKGGWDFGAYLVNDYLVCLRVCYDSTHSFPGGKLPIRHLIQAYKCCLLDKYANYPRTHFEVMSLSSVIAIYGQPMGSATAFLTASQSLTALIRLTPDVWDLSKPGVVEPHMNACLKLLVAKQVANQLPVGASDVDFNPRPNERCFYHFSFNTVTGGSAPFLVKTLFTHLPADLGKSVDLAFRAIQPYVVKDTARNIRQGRDCCTNICLIVLDSQIDPDLLKASLRERVHSSYPGYAGWNGIGIYDMRDFNFSVSGSDPFMQDPIAGWFALNKKYRGRPPFSVEKGQKTSFPLPNLKKDDLS